MINQNVIYRSAASIIGMILFAGVMLGGCSKPAVKHTSISGHVRDVQNWSIRWAGQTDSTVEVVSVEGLVGESKYKLPEFSLRYVNDVRTALSRTHNYQFLDNMPTGAEIVITLYGLKSWSMQPHVTDAEKIADELAEGETPPPDLREFSAISESIPVTTDNVKRVNIAIYSVDGQSLGEIFIGGDPDDHVKPAYVAQAIADILGGKNR